MTRFLFLIATILSAATSVNSQTVEPTLSPTAVTEPKRDNGLLAAVVIITSVIILGMCCWLGCSIRYNKQHCCRTGSCVNADEIKNKKGDYEGDNGSDDGHEDEGNNEDRFRDQQIASWNGSREDIVRQACCGVLKTR